MFESDDEDDFGSLRRQEVDGCANDPVTLGNQGDSTKTEEIGEEGGSSLHLAVSETMDSAASSDE